MSSGLVGLTTKKNPLTVVTRASCGRTTPFGVPVEPLVYIIMAVKKEKKLYYQFVSASFISEE